MSDRGRNDHEASERNAATYCHPASLQRLNVFELVMGTSWTVLGVMEAFLLR